MAQLKFTPRALAVALAMPLALCGAAALPLHAATPKDTVVLAMAFDDLISLDPPRSGLSPEALEVVVNAGAPKILYVSCDPGTWARDVARLNRGGYKLTHVQPWDFYPQTSHVEVLSLLELE